LVSHYCTCVGLILLSVPCSSPPTASQGRAASLPRSRSVPIFSLKFEWIQRAFGRSSGCESWGAILGDLRSFVQVLKFIQDPIIMIPPRTGRGWGREGFGTRRLGRGDDRGGHQGYAW
jgi:hypothetical protein